MTKPDAWNHNYHYHLLVLATVPEPCRRALDVGCGAGLLTAKLAPLCTETVGLDTDTAMLQAARKHGAESGRLNFIDGDAMFYPFPEASFDFITLVATLHHLPLRPALLRLRALLRPGGVLAVVGLYRAETLNDHLFAAAAIPASWAMKRMRTSVDQKAPMTPPKETLAQIRRESGACLPGSVVKRRLFFRYSLLWRKPADLVRQLDRTQG